MIADNTAHLFPLGTAFNFSKFNHIFTARHCIEEGLKQHHPDGNRFAHKGLEAARTFPKLKHTQLAVVSQGPNPKRGDVSLDIRRINSIHAAPPTDLVIGSILSDESALVPSLDPVISFAPPRIGETVRCVGYCDSRVPEGGLSLAEMIAGSLNPYDCFSHRLVAIEGRVKHIFLRGLSSGFATGPCFTIDVEVPHGLSGGPIFNSSGAICGAIYTGASMFFGAPTTVGALFYPIFLLRLSFGISMAHGRFNLTATDRPLADLVSTNMIRTDGAEEEQLHFSSDDKEVRIGASFAKEDRPYIFDDFSAYQDGRPAPSLETRRVKVFKPNLDNPLVRKRRGLNS
jgi:hypothetical protein